MTEGGAAGTLTLKSFQVAPEVPRTPTTPGSG
jgi:hypothetical protein